MSVSRRRMLQGLGGLLAAAVGTGVGLGKLGLPIGNRAGAQSSHHEAQRQWPGRGD